MTRHSFVWSLLAMVLALFRLRLPETPPRLWGDGVHDDSYALQWRLDRATAQNPLVLRNGTFALDRGIVLRYPYSIDWVDNVFKGTPKFFARGGPGFTVG